MADEMDRVFTDLVIPLRGIFGVGARWNSGIFECADEVRDGAAIFQPSLLPDQMTHLAPALEGLHKPAHRYRGAIPSQLFQILRQPDLKRLGFDRLHLRHHLSPAQVALDKFPADEG